MRSVVVMALVAGVAVAVALAQEKQDRATKVRSDRERVEAAGRWIYDDLPRGIEAAKRSGKPLLVVFRCIPCEACAKLDEDVVTGDPVVAGLLEKFVCVRIPRANGMDLSLFQFDYDQSWAAFLMNADLTVYGRYGTRSHETRSEDDVSLEGFAKALEGALALHADSGKHVKTLASKRGKPAAVKVPEALPSLEGKYKSTLDWGGKVVASCIHCHQIREAERRVHRDAGRPIPEDVLFPYPNPKVLGLVMDPKERGRVKSVAAGSPAEKDGFLAGDEIVTIEGTPILSIADVQWALSRVLGAGSLDAEVLRDGRTVPLRITLPRGWRQRDDLSWRATSWDLRRMVTGGLLLEDLGPAERKSAGLSDTAMALRVRHVGQYGDHAVGKNAGFQKDDVVLAVEGAADRRTESELMAALLSRTKPGDRVDVTVLRDGRKLELKLRMQ